MTTNILKSSNAKRLVPAMQVGVGGLEPPITCSQDKWVAATLYTENRTYRSRTDILLIEGQTASPFA